jgi:hypothetical protein
MKIEEFNVGKKVYIKKHSFVAQDFRYFLWEEDNQIFAIDETFKDSKKIRLCSFGYGLHGQPGSYGNGAVYALKKDVFPISALGGEWVAGKEVVLPEPPLAKLHDDLVETIMKHRTTIVANVPESVIADYIISCLESLDVAMKAQGK